MRLISAEGGSVKNNVFAENAPAYFAKGYSALPVKPGTKGTNIAKWTSFCTTLPTLEQQKSWAAKFGNYGIAVALGKKLPNGNLLGAIDVDDDRLIRLAQGIAGPSRCTKRGKKGLTLFVQFSPAVRNGTVYITDPELGRQQAADILAAGKMTVLPPTIHPETGQPYEWRADELLDARLEDLPMWDEREVILFKRLSELPETLQVMSGTATHDPTVKVCQCMCAVELTEERICLLMKAILPKGYTGDTLTELPRIVKWARENHQKDQRLQPTNGKEPPITDKLVQWGREQTLYTDTLGRTFISINNSTKENKHESL